MDGQVLKGQSVPRKPPRKAASPAAGIQPAVRFVVVGAALDVNERATRSTRDHFLLLDQILNAANLVADKEHVGQIDGILAAGGSKDQIA
jgi:hypothetical protein